MSDAPLLTRHHHRRLREIYRSAGWPCHDMLEVELLAAGQVERVRSPDGHETLRVTDAGIQTLARPHAVLDRPDAAPLKVTRGELRFEAVRFAYPGRATLLQGFDLHVPAGSSLGISNCGRRNWVES